MISLVPHPVPSHHPFLGASAFGKETLMEMKQNLQADRQLLLYRALARGRDAKQPRGYVLKLH
jgi:hypothetical protein